MRRLVIGRGLALHIFCSLSLWIDFCLRRRILILIFYDKKEELVSEEKATWSMCDSFQLSNNENKLHHVES